MSDPRPKKTLTVTAILALGVVLTAGAVLQASLGSRFIFFFAEQYERGAWFLFILLLPTVAIGMISERALSEARRRFPTWWIRWLIVLPVGVAMFAGGLVVGPIGWLSAFTWAFGTEVSAVPAQVVSVESHLPGSKYCDQHGAVALRHYVSTVCLEGIGQLPMQTGTAVLLNGRQSRLGFQIGEIERR